jgi:soluble lytic murein transglycosylase-like protein
VIVWFISALLTAGLASGPVAQPFGPPSPLFFESAPAQPAPRKLTSGIKPPQNQTLHTRRAEALAKAISFISTERFDEALAFIRRQNPELRDWSGLASLEAGLISVKDPEQALDIYYRIINGKTKDHHWVRALNGYRVTLAKLAEKGDYSAKAKLIRTLGLEWRNNEARLLLKQTLQQGNLPDDLKNELDAFGAVLALRVGDFDEAMDFWKNRDDEVSLRWLSTLCLRQGQFETAAWARGQVAERLRGAAQLQELERRFDIMVKGGLTTEAEELIQQWPGLAKRMADHNFSLGISALLSNEPQKAQAYFQKETERKGGRLVASLYFLGRTMEMLDDRQAAIGFYRRAAASPLGYYRLLAEGRLATLSGNFKKLALAEPMANLLKSPGGELWGDRGSLGFYLWLSERLPAPWPDIYAAFGLPLKADGSGDIALAREAVEHYLAAGDFEAALEELLAATETIVPVRTSPDDPGARKFIFLAAIGGEYRLAVNLLNRLDTDAPGQRWNHPAVFGRPVLGAWRRFGLSPQLILSVIRTESAFQSWAVSSSNARGLMQLLPSTAGQLARLAGQEQPSEEALFNPDLNIRYGAAYLVELLKAFGNVPLALASYNGGPFNIGAYMKASPRRPLDLFIETLPFSESSIYVKRVIESVAVYESAYLGRYNYHDLTAPVGQAPADAPDF